MMDKDKGVTYADSGVVGLEGVDSFQTLIKWVQKTMEGHPEVKAEVGLYATVLEIGPNLGLAMSTDGVGTKILVAEMMKKYDTIGIDWSYNVSKGWTVEINRTNVSLGPSNTTALNVTISPDLNVTAFSGLLVNITGTSRGNPVKLRVPKEPGTYEVRYILGRGSKLLDKTTIEITP